MRGRRDWAHKDEGRKGEELEVQEKDRRVKWTICYGQQCPWQIWQWQQQWLNGSGLGSAQPNILQIHRFTIQNRHSKRTLLLVLPSSSRVTTAPLEQVRQFPTLLFSGSLLSSVSHSFLSLSLSISFVSKPQLCTRHLRLGQWWWRTIKPLYTFFYLPDPDNRESLFLLFGSTTIILVLGLMSIRHFASCIRRFNCRRSESVFFCFLLEVNSAQLCERRYFHLIPQFLS